jgi:hypothetical protein
MGWLFLLVPVALAVGIGTGMALTSWAPTPKSAKAKTAAPAAAMPAAAPVGEIRIEEMKEVQELFALGGQRAVVLKYVGGDVNFWIEVDIQGRQEKIGDHLGIGLFGDDKQPAANQTIEGYFVWVRSEADDAGDEQWTVAHRRDLVAAEKSALRVPIPLVQAEVTKSKETRSSTSSSIRQPVRVWKGKFGGGSTTTSTSTSLANPLPLDREIRIKEIREERRKSLGAGRAVPAVAASTLGLASPCGGGLVTVAAAVPAQDEADAHTFRVMCRAAQRK